MPASFPLVQSAQATGPFGDPTNPTIDLGTVTEGNIIVAAIAYSEESEGSQVPTCSDGLGNLYILECQSGGAYNNLTPTSARNKNVSNVSCIFVAQGNFTTKYGGIVGGACTIKFSNVPVLWSSRTSPLFLFGAELQTPAYYQVFGTWCIDDAEGGLAEAHTLFRSVIANGSPGGADCSDTGIVDLTIAETLTGSEEEVNHTISAVALINPPLGACLVAIDYDPDAGFAGFTGWTSSGTVMQSASTGTGDGQTAAVFVLQTFPYLGGPPPTPPGGGGGSGGGGGGGGVGSGGPGGPGGGPGGWPGGGFPGGGPGSEGGQLTGDQIAAALTLLGLPSYTKVLGGGSLAACIQRARAVLLERKLRRLVDFWWLFPPFASDDVLVIGSVALPGIGTQAVALEYTVPSGLRFVMTHICIMASVAGALNSAFAPGDGSVSFVLDLNEPLGSTVPQGVPVKGFNALSVPLGSFNVRPWPLSCPRVFHPLDQLRWKVTNVSLGTSDVWVAAGVFGYTLQVDETS